MTKGVRWVILAAGLFALAATFTNGYAQNSPPGPRGFNLLRRSHATRKPLKLPAQNSSFSSPVRDTQALTLANQALNSLTGGSPITDVTVRANANYIAGSDQESGTATLEARIGYESWIALTLSGGQRSEIHNASGAPPQAKSSGPDGIWQAAPLHNCWVDPTWFFPALTIQSAMNDQQISFIYVGQETKLGSAVQHIQISRLVPGQTATATSLIQRLSKVDLYLDSTTNLPVAIDFNIHSDLDASLDLPLEVQFSGWHAANGFQGPSQIQKFLQGSLTLELTGVTISVNTGLPQSDFAI